jgi:PKD domain-containing protein
MKLVSTPFLRRTTTILVIFTLFFGLLSFVSPFSGLHSLLPRIPSVRAATPNILGFDCGYGSSLDGAPFPSSVTTPSFPYAGPDYDGNLNTSCQATYFADQETPPTLHPLVSDNPTTLTPGSGGGLTIDVIAALNSTTGAQTTAITGFDVSVRYDPKVLNAVLIDQTGLIWGGVGLPTGAFVLTPAKAIDPLAGTVRLSQALVAANPQTGNVELFRVRFDVVGASLGTSITFFNDVLVNPGIVPTVDQSLAVDTTSIFNTLGGAVLNFVSNWTFTPKPEVPGTSLTLTAMASCPGCAGALSYNWDFSSNDAPTYVPKSQAATNPATITPPPPVVNRVTLTITDAATPTPHSLAVTRLLPLVSNESPSFTTLAAGVASGAWSGQWLGGVTTATAGYTGGWTMCPGSALNKVVCSVPSVQISQSGAGITELTSAGPETYNFAGLYNATLKVADAPETQIGTAPTGNVVLLSFLNNVTGTPAAYTVSVTAAASSPIVGTSDNFTATIAYNSTYPAGFRSTTFNYVFDFGDGTPKATALAGKTVSLFHNFTSSGNFLVKVVAQEASTSAVSRIIENGFLTVNPLVALCKVAGSCTFTIGTSSILAGTSTSFTATVSGGSTPYYFVWNFGDSSTATGQTANHTYQSAGTYTVTLTITDSNGQTQVVKKTITVASNPAGVFSSPLVIAGIAAAAVTIALAAFLVYSRRRRKVARQSQTPLGSP